MREISHNFHNKMPLQLTHIVKLLELAKISFKGTKEEISIQSGIPTGEGSGKVVSHIEFAKSMGLIDYEKERAVFALSLTSLGECIYEQDPYLLENVTKWICHYWLTDKEIGIPQWYYFMRDIPSPLNVSQDIEFIEKRIQQNFNSKIHMPVVYTTYGPDCFEELGIVSYRRTEGKVIFNEVSSNIVYKYVYAYTLLKSWEIQFPTYKEITINQVIEELKWNRAFGFDYDEVLNVLEDLSGDNIITLNKQLTPMTIIKVEDSDAMLPHLYDLVF